MSNEKEFQRLPGFRDFPPAELAARNRLFEAWRRVARRHGFEEYDAPPLESLDLYVEKSGEEIVGQLYAFTDQGGREVSLRPEMTPSLARVLGERSRSLAKPIRWFSVPQLFRYERQQRGRLREHFQWNVDIVGEAGPAADAEVLAVAIEAVRELGLTHEVVVARVSDRKLLSALLEEAGVAPDRMEPVFTVVDKMEREPADRIRERLVERVGLEPTVADAVLALFQETDLEAIEARFSHQPAVAERLEVLRDYFTDLEAMGLAPFVTFDLTIVRGLAYYTGIVFELFDRKGELRAICGGGRYDRLLELVGGEPLPAVGFGMGDVVLGELLEREGLQPEYAREVDVFIVPIRPEQRDLALRIAQAQRERGRSAVYALREQSVRKQFQAAEAAGARSVVILGPDEVDRGRAMVRNMASGDEEERALDELLGDT